MSKTILDVNFFKKSISIVIFSLFFSFELPASFNSADHIKIKLHLKEAGGYSHSSNFFGQPLFLLVPKQSLTYGALYQHIANSMRRFLKNASTSTGDEINSNLNKSLSKYRSL